MSKYLIIHELKFHCFISSVNLIFPMYTPIREGFHQLKNSINRGFSLVRKLTVREILSHLRYHLSFWFFIAFDAIRVWFSLWFKPRYDCVYTVWIVCICIKWLIFFFEIVKINRLTLRVNWYFHMNFRNNTINQWLKHQDQLILLTNDPTLCYVSLNRCSSKHRSFSRLTNQQ